MSSSKQILQRERRPCRGVGGGSRDRESPAEAAEPPPRAGRTGLEPGIALLAAEVEGRTTGGGMVEDDALLLEVEIVWISIRVSVWWVWEERGKKLLFTGKIPIHFSSCS